VTTLVAFALLSFAPVMAVLQRGNLLTPQRLDATSCGTHRESMHEEDLSQRRGSP